MSQIKFVTHFYFSYFSNFIFSKYSQNILLKSGFLFAIRFTSFNIPIAGISATQK